MARRTRALILCAVALALVALQAVLVRHVASVGIAAVHMGFFLTAWAPAMLALILSDWWSLGK